MLTLNTELLYLFLTLGIGKEKLKLKEILLEIRFDLKFFKEDSIRIHGSLKKEFISFINNISNQVKSIRCFSQRLEQLP